MAQIVREIRETREPDAPLAVRRGSNLAARIVSFVGGTIVALLGIRFVLALLGANPANAFANFIYSVTHPFVAPFFGLFNYTGQLGVVRFEFETLIAMLFWAFITWMIVRLLTIGDRDSTI